MHKRGDAAAGGSQRSAAYFSGAAARLMAAESAAGKLSRLWCHAHPARVPRWPRPDGSNACFELVVSPALMTLRLLQRPVRSKSGATWRVC